MKKNVKTDSYIICGCGSQLQFTVPDCNTPQLCYVLKAHFFSKDLPSEVLSIFTHQYSFCACVVEYAKVQSADPHVDIEGLF